MIHICWVNKLEHQIWGLFQSSCYSSLEWVFHMNEHRYSVEIPFYWMLSPPMQTRVDRDFDGWIIKRRGGKIYVYDSYSNSYKWNEAHYISAPFMAIIWFELDGDVIIMRCLGLWQHKISFKMRYSPGTEWIKNEFLRTEDFEWVNNISIFFIQVFMKVQFKLTSNISEKLFIRNKFCEISNN